MTQDEGARPDPVRVPDMEVGMADAARGQSDRDLARAWLVDLELLHAEALAGSLQDGRTHDRHRQGREPPGQAERARRRPPTMIRPIGQARPQSNPGMTWVASATAPMRTRTTPPTTALVSG